MEKELSESLWNKVEAISRDTPMIMGGQIWEYMSQLLQW